MVAVMLARQCLTKIETMSVLDGYTLESGISDQLTATENGRALMRRFVKR